MYSGGYNVVHRHTNGFDVCLSVHRCICVENKNQLDVTECFIALTICSTCFGYFYAHHQDLKTCVTTALVAGCWGSGAGQQAVHPGRGMLTACCPAPDLRQPATKHCTP